MLKGGKQGRKEKVVYTPAWYRTRNLQTIMTDALGDLQIVVIITENRAMQTILDPIKSHAISKSVRFKA